MSKTQTYPSDLTDEQWALIQPLLPKPHKRGRRRRLNYRHVLDAVFSAEMPKCRPRIVKEMQEFVPSRRVGVA